MMIVQVKFLIIYILVQLLVHGNSDELPEKVTFSSNFLGISDFKFLKEQRAPLVDKSLFIEEAVNNPNTVIFITRPRGFGKSFALSLLDYYLSNRHSSAGLFQGTKIFQNQTFARGHLNKHPVIHVSLATKSTDYASVLVDISETVGELYKEHSYLMSEKPLGRPVKPNQRKRFAKYKEPKAANLRYALTFLIELMHNHFKQKVILLVDDFDAPGQAGYVHKFYEKVMSEVQRMLRKAIRDNPLLDKAVFCGVAQITGDHLVSKIENVTYHSVASDSFSTSFGFTEKEMEELVKNDPTHSIDKIKEQFEGYTIGNHTMYNPSSVLAALSSGATNKPFWTGTIAKSDFTTLLSTRGILPILEAEILMDGVAIHHHFNDLLVLPEIIQDDAMFWTLMTSLGYVTFAKNVIVGALNGKAKEYNCERYDAHLRIPNKEVALVFNETVQKYFSKHPKAKPYAGFKESLVSKNSSQVQEYLQAYLDDAVEHYYVKDSFSGLEAIKGFLSVILQGLRKDYKQVDLWTEMKSGTDVPQCLVSNITSGPENMPKEIVFRISKGKNGLRKYWVQLCRLFGRPVAYVELSNCVDFGIEMRYKH